MGTMVTMRRVGVAFLMILSTWVEASSFPDEAVLTVSGNIEGLNADPEDNSVRLDLPALQTLPQVRISTKTPWHDNVHVFEGPLLEDVLAFAGARGEQLQLTALNDYRITVDFGTLKDYRPILAWQKDGQPMRVRDKGPLWLILPLDDHEVLQHSSYYDLMIWQLNRIDVE